MSARAVQEPRDPARAAWLNLVREPVIEPDLPIIDSHVHVFEKPGWRYTFEDLVADAADGHAIWGSVYIEAGSRHADPRQTGVMYRLHGPGKLRSLGETEYATGLGAMSASGTYGQALGLCAGIIGFVDLELGAEAREVMERHAQFERFRGIRYLVAWDASDDVRRPMLDTREGMLREESIREGLRALDDLGLSIDISLLHPQLPDLIEIASSFPGLQIVLCHIGTPIGIGPYASRKDEVFAEWKRDLELLGKFDNVAVKVGGLGRNVYGHNFQHGKMPPTSDELSSAFEPFFDVCFDAFGTERCMFESDFPENKRSFSYHVLWNSFKKLTASFSTSERADLFFETARRIYKLDVPEPVPHETIDDEAMPSYD
jgi:predicted TIM-barrel fold metal-dependent hydrolase